MKDVNLKCCQITVCNIDNYITRIIYTKSGERIFIRNFQNFLSMATQTNSGMAPELCRISNREILLNSGCFKIKSLE